MQRWRPEFGIGWNKFRQLVPLLTSKDVFDYESKVV